MEIRFLDDMRRRSSLLQPSYGLSLLAPGNTGTPAPLPYGEREDRTHATVLLCPCAC